MSDSPADAVGSVDEVDGDDRGEVAEASPGVVAEYRAARLDRVRGDDQVVCAAWLPGSVHVGQEPGVRRRCGLGVVEDRDVVLDRGQGS